MRTISKRLLILLVLLLASMQLAAEELINFEVTESGMHQVSFEQLQDAGLDILGEPLTNIGLLNKGAAVAVEIVGSTLNPANFGPGAKIRFYGQSIDTLYTGTNVYTLVLDATLHTPLQARSIPVPARAPTAASYLAKKVFAPQTSYSFVSPDDNDPWYAKRMSALQGATQETVNLELNDYVPGGNSGSVRAKLNVEVWGASNIPSSDSDHHLKVSMNGTSLIDEVFDGFSGQRYSAEVQSLNVGNNEVTLELPLDQGVDFDVVNLNSVEVQYPRGFVAQDNKLSFVSRFTKFLLRGFTTDTLLVYVIEDGTISRIDNTAISGRCQIGGSCSVIFGGSGQVAEYFALDENEFIEPELAYLPVQADIRSDQAEYLIITHPDFIAEAGEQDQLARLVTSLEEQFSSVALVDVEQIYAQFANHIFDPTAIRDYIEFSRDNLGTQMVLLVGGDIYDYRNFENEDARSFIPSLYVATDDLIRFAPVDPKYVDFNDDNVPDLPIGRLPVRTMQELKVLIDKREDYLTRSYQDTAVFAADGFSDLEQYSFTQDAELVRQDYFSDWNVTSAYVDSIGVRGARQTITSSINSGVSLTSFFGHSSISQWSFDGLFNGFDVVNLQNQGRPTVVTQWGCWNTYHVNPNEDSMGHRFMMEGDRGAVAVMGATTLTSAHNERLLADLVFQRMSQGMPLGIAITEAKAEFALSRPDALDVLLGWTLLGMPELRL